MQIWALKMCSISRSILGEYIPKHLEKLIFDRVGFASDFLSKALAVSISTAARLWQKIRSASLSNSQFFKVFGYQNRVYSFRMGPGLICLLACIQAALCYAEIEDLDHIPLNEMSQEPLFISLGSHCEPAHALRLGGLRKAAFPFDWIISFDGEALIEILQEDFRHFLEDEYFLSFGPAGHLLHSYYHLEFLHEGDFNVNFLEQLQELKSKYQRRIDRFRKLNNYSGEIVFIRSSYEFSVTDPHRCYKFEDNVEISDAYAFKLHEALKKYFPNLKYKLIIINKLDHEGVEEIKLSESLFKIKLHSSDVYNKIDMLKLELLKLTN